MQIAAEDDGLIHAGLAAQLQRVGRLYGDLAPDDVGVQNQATEALTSAGNLAEMGLLDSKPYFAQALELTTKLQTPFLEKVSQALLTLDPNNMGSARGYLTAQGFTVEQLDVNPDGRGDLIRLSEDVDPERATARYEQGIVTVTLPIASKPLIGARYTIVVERL